MFYKDEVSGEVFYIYLCYGCGVEVMMGIYLLLDFVFKGCDEEWLGYGMEWVWYYDCYEDLVLV